MSTMEILGFCFINFAIGILLSKIVVDILEDYIAYRANRRFWDDVWNYYECNKITMLILTMLLIVTIALWRIASLKIMLLPFGAGFMMNVLQYFLSFKHSIVEIHHSIEIDKSSVGRSSALVYVMNYLEIISSEFTDRVKTFEQVYQRRNTSLQHDALPAYGELENSFFSKKLYIFIPKSGVNSYATIADVDSCFEPMGNLTPYECDKNGTKKRHFDNTVYKLKSNGNRETVFFVCEFATPLTAISHIQRLKKSHGTLFPDQVKLFYLKLEEILRKKNVKFGNVFQPIYYDDDIGEHVVCKQIWNKIVEERYLS